MLARLEKLKSELATGGSVVGGFPFCKEIQKEVLYLNVQQPHLGYYEGTSDPEDHLAYFLNTLQLYNFSDVIMCKLFASSLKGVARSWFSQLPAASIKTHFCAHFMANRKTERDYSYFFTITQKKEESLKDYMMRFNRAKLKVPGVESRSAVVVQGLLIDSSFYLSVSKLKFTTMEQFAAKVDKYILQEENIATRKGIMEKKDRAEGSH